MRHALTHYTVLFVCVILVWGVFHLTGLSEFTAKDVTVFAYFSGGWWTYHWLLSKERDLEQERRT